MHDFIRLRLISRKIAQPGCLGSRQILRYTHADMCRIGIILLAARAMQVQPTLCAKREMNNSVRTRQAVYPWEEKLKEQARLSARDDD